MIAFISGHLDLTKEEFEEHYIPVIGEAIRNGDTFIVGDARGTDIMAQDYIATLLGLYEEGSIGVNTVTVYHMFTKPRNCATMHYSLVGGFKSDDERDAAMTNASDYDIAWIRPGREKSGTAKNIARRTSNE